MQGEENTVAQALTSQTYRLQDQKLAMERRSRELKNRMQGRRKGLHVEPAADLLDSLQLAADRDFEIEHLNRETEELSLIQRALDTISAGVYGQCIECEEEISPKRLKIMPWAVRCISCQQRIEDSANSIHQQQPSSWEPSYATI